MRILLRIVAVIAAISVLATLLFLIQFGSVGLRALVHSGAFGMVTIAGWLVTVIAGPIAAVQLFRLRPSGRIAAAILFSSMLLYYGAGYFVFREASASTPRIIGLCLFFAILVAVVMSPAAQRVCQASRLIGVLLVLLAASLTGCNASPDILLFHGDGTSPNDVAALQTLLSENHLHYATVDSRQLNAMSDAQLAAYRLLIVPGGNFETIGKGLTANATANIRNAVRNRGLNYLGICAGAFFAGSSPYNGLNLTSGVRFPFYAAENSGLRKQAVKIAIAGSASLVHYWEDGPELTGWGDVVAKYPDGTPAIVEGKAGGGWVILSGIHPEAPEGWRRGMSFTTPASVDNAYAITLVRAALNRTRLGHY